MTIYKIEKAEEGTPDVDTYLESGSEPFAVVSTPVTEPITEYIGGAVIPTGRERTVGYVNVIWFRWKR